MVAWQCLTTQKACHEARLQDLKAGRFACRQQSFQDGNFHCMLAQVAVGAPASINNVGGEWLEVRHCTRQAREATSKAGRQAF